MSATRPALALLVEGFDPQGLVRAVAEGPRDWGSPVAVALLGRLAREKY